MIQDKNGDVERGTLPEGDLRNLQKYCFFLTKSKWDGDDLFQDVLLKTMPYAELSDSGRDMKPLLFRAARNLWIDVCRARKRRRNMLRMPFSFCRRDSDYAEIRGWIEWLADRLPVRNVEMWLLSEYFGYSMKEIAETAGCSVSAVKSLLHRTREMLRDGPSLKIRRSNKRDDRRRFDVELWTQAIMRDIPPFPHAGIPFYRELTGL